MIKLCALVPSSIDFRETLGAAERNPAAYEEFWQAVERRLLEDSVFDANTMTVARARRDNKGWGSIVDDDLDRPVEVLSLRFNPQLFPLTPPEPLELIDIEDAITCRLYNHGVFSVELECSVAEGPDSPLAPRLDDIDEAFTEWIPRFIKFLHDRFLVQIVTSIRDVDPRAEFVEPAARTLPGRDGCLGRPLWITRSLCIQENDPALADLVNEWLRDVEAVEPGVAQRLIDPGSGLRQFARWFHHVFLMTEDELRQPLPQTFPDMMFALRYAQYFYGATEQEEIRLKGILALSLAKDPPWPMAELRRELEQGSRRVAFIEMERSEIRKFLRRARLREFDGLLESWKFDEIVVQPAREKVDAADKRLSELSETRSSRASLFTDVILLAIGITSVVSTTLALTEFGRTMNSDPGMASYDGGGSRLVAWFAAQSADGLLLASIAACLILTVLYLYFRRLSNR